MISGERNDAIGERRGCREGHTCPAGRIVAQRCSWKGTPMVSYFLTVYND